MNLWGDNMRRLLSFFNKTVTRIRPGSITERGITYPDWDNTSELQIDNCVVTWQGTTLSQDGRIMGISDTKMLYAPLDADFKAGDRIRYGTKTYEIDGDPMDWESPTGALNHFEIPLKRYEG